VVGEAGGLIRAGVSLCCCCCCCCCCSCLLLAEMEAFAQQRSRFYQQVNENGMVKQELDILEPNTVVYKMIGPVLMRQDLDEARQNVNKRIELIQVSD
jgi:chaperonin cofactor prefoldin